jgi:hypothetical protein
MTVVIGNGHQAIGSSELFTARSVPLHRERVLPALQSSARGDARISQATEAAEKFVASALVLPALASLQESPLRPKDGPFAMGTAERRFAPLLHAEFADRVTKAANFGLVTSIVERFAGRSMPPSGVYA